MDDLKIEKSADELADELASVRRQISDLKSRERNIKRCLGSKPAYVVNFDAVPPIGTRITYSRGRRFTLVAVEDYTRKDGTPSHILVWHGDAGGVGTTGMKSAGMQWRVRP